MRYGVFNMFFEAYWQYKSSPIAISITICSGAKLVLHLQLTTHQSLCSGEHCIGYVPGLIFAHF